LAEPNQIPPCRRTRGKVLEDNHAIARTQQKGPMTYVLAKSGGRVDEWVALGRAEVMEAGKGNSWGRKARGQKAGLDTSETSINATSRSANTGVQFETVPQIVMAHTKPIYILMKLDKP